jgi:flagellar basal body rod protein FlgC
MAQKKKKSGIHIKPSHKGKLTAKVGKKGLTSKNLAKEKTAAKKSGNTTLEKEVVFAQNAKKWHHGK